MSPSKPPILPPERTQDLPATIAMLEEVRKEFSFHKGYTEGRAESHFNALMAAIQQMGTSIRAEIRHEVGAVRADLAEVKADLAAFKAETKAEFAEVKADLAAFKGETKAEFAEVKADLAAFKGETKAEFTALAAFKGETKAEFAELRGEISGIKMLVEHQTAQNAAAMQSISLLNHKMDQGFRELKEENADIKAAMKTMAKTLKTLANNHSKTSVNRDGG